MRHRDGSTIRRQCDSNTATIDGGDSHLLSHFIRKTLASCRDSQAYEIESIVHATLSSTERQPRPSGKEASWIEWSRASRKRAQLLGRSGGDGALVFREIVHKGHQRESICLGIERMPFLKRPETGQLFFVHDSHFGKSLTMRQFTCQ